MKEKIYNIRVRPLILFTVLLVGWLGRASGQTTLSTTTGFLNNNGSGTVTFNLHNTNSSGIVITDIEGLTGTSGSVNVEMYYNPTPVNGSPGNISSANGWVLVGSATITGVANTSSTTTQPFLTGLNFVIPANTTYGIAVFATGQRYYGTGSQLTATTISAGGLDLITGPNIGYGGGTPPATPTNTPRGWIGKISFIPQLPCVAPPTPGTVTASSTNVCSGSPVALSLNGNSMGTGQTYEWQSSASATGPWTTINTPAPTPSYTINPTSTLYYRAAVTCGASVAYSDSVLVTVPTPFAGGTYTINSAVATGGTNFQSFTDAVSAISCGISGPVVFNVTPGSGPYVEQVIIPASVGASAANTVTFNGNGATLSYTSTNSSLRGIVMLDGADYITIDSLVIHATGSTSSEYGWGVHLINDADSNTISNCTIQIDTLIASTNYGGIIMSGSYTSATTSGSNCDGNLITGNTIDGGYYGMTVMTTTGNTISNNTIRNFYIYGMYTSANTDILIEGNDISRPTRPSFSSYYGIFQSGVASNNRISKNRLHDPFGSNPSTTSTLYGIYLSSSDASVGSETVVSNNVFYNMFSDGTMYIFYNVGSNYALYYYNSIAVIDPSSTSSAIVRGLYQTTSAIGIEMKNNAFTINRGGTGAKYGFYFGTSATTFTSDNNAIFVAGGSSDYFGYKGGNQPTLTDWQTATSQDANSTASNAGFTNPSSGNLTPTLPALDNAGTPVSVTTDILGAARNATTPDIGAYEFSVPPCGGQPFAGTAAGPASICSGSNATLTLTGYTIGSGITIQWEYLDPNLFQWTQIPGATTAIYTVTGQSVATDYRATITCFNGGGMDISNTVTVSMSSFLSCYCASSATSASYEDIFNVTIGALNNSSDCNTGNNMYTDYSAGTKPNLPQGATLPISIEIGTCNTSGTAIAKVFIDFNQNGDYTDVGEEAFVSAAVASATSPGTVVTGNIAVPTTAIQGLTGMRVVLERTSSASGVTPCGTYTYGETEDYQVFITPPPSCMSAGIPVVTGIVSTSATATWTQSPTNPTMGYEWRLFPLGQGPWGTPILSGTEPVGDTVASLSPLTAVTDYTFFVRSVCSATDTSTWTSEVFSTPCAAFLAPYTHDVESQNANTNSVMNGCWTSSPTNSTSTYAWHVTGTGTTSSSSTGPNYANSGSKYFYVEASYGSANATAELITPQVDVTSLTSPMVEFYYHMYGATINKLIISAYNGTTWNDVDSIVGQQQTSETAPWIKKSVMLNGYTGIIQVKFTAVRGTSFTGDISIDDIAIMQAPTCPGASNPDDSTTMTSAILSWTETGTATQWQVEYGLGNFTQGTGTSVYVTSNPYTLSGLTHTTAYSYFVRSICGPNDTSAWTPRRNFATIPNNDTCQSAINIGGGQPTNGTTAGATQTMPSGSCASSTTYANDVWYYFTTGSTGTVTVTATNTVGDVVLEVLSGTCGSLVSLDCQDSPAIGTETATLTNLPPGVYYVRVYGYLSIQNPFVVQVTGTTLAIRLLDISATNAGTRNRVDWKTAEEVKGDAFTVERSADGKTFAALGTLDAHGTPSTYSYWDERPLNGVNYYRLRMTDAAGTVTYSKVVTATARTSEAFLLSAYPNPASDRVTVTIQGAMGSNAQILVTDLTGKTVRQITGAAAQMDINLQGLASGMYLIKYTDDLRTETIRLNKK